MILGTHWSQANEAFHAEELQCIGESGAVVTMRTRLQRKQCKTSKTRQNELASYSTCMWFYKYDQATWKAPLKTEV